MKTRILLALLCVAAMPPRLAAAEGPLHLASPDWRDQVIYFAMIDRFDDGDPGNNEQGANVYDPDDAAKYSGGDLAGLTRRVDYIRRLGATALWITPPVANQWWDARAQFSGYHGYWAENFTEVDAHYGTLADYRAFSRRLHGAGMYLVQDIVVNHVGNFFSYVDGYDPADPVRFFRRNSDARPRPSPTQPPFDRNDVRDPAHRDAAIYHWTPAIRDYADPHQERTWALADLDDLNTTNPVVRGALRSSFGHWIREVGVDAFRVDTAFYVEPEFFRDFLHAESVEAPGVLKVARATGRDAFHLFGEGFGVDPPFADDKARKIERWARDADGDLLPGMINFPLYGSSLDVFARGAPAAVLAHRIRSMMQVHARPHLMPTFVDNHDVDRFLAGGSEAGLKQALLLILTLPGIPTIYYGTEQGFTAPRAAMFARGHGSGGRDHFDPQAPMYRWLQRAIELRHAQTALRRGVPEVIEAEGAGPGVLAYRMRGEGEELLVVFNSADHASLLADVATGLAPRARLEPLFAIEGEAPALMLDDRARFSLSLPPRAGLVWRVRLPAGPDDTTSSEAFPQLSPIAPDVVGEVLEVEGRALPGASLQVVIDGDLSRAVTPRLDPDGRWRARLDLAHLIDESSLHRVVAWEPGNGRSSTARAFRVVRDWQPRARHVDPADDDRGPDGRYRYPTDPLFAARRPLDLRAVDISSAGTALQIEVQMRELLATWQPANGFDHLLLTLFIELPGRADGVRAMPLQDAQLPGDMRWHYRLRVGGWSNAVFSSVGASATNEGTAVAPAPALVVDRERNSITLRLSPATLGNPDSLDGARIHVTSWDYDGGYRAIAAEPKAFTFGGGGDGSPRVMDDSGIIVLDRTEP